MFGYLVVWIIYILKRIRIYLLDKLRLAPDLAWSPKRKSILGTNACWIFVEVITRSSQGRYFNVKSLNQRSIARNLVRFLVTVAFRSFIIRATVRTKSEELLPRPHRYVYDAMVLLQPTPDPWVLRDLMADRQVPRLLSPLLAIIAVAFKRQV